MMKGSPLERLAAYCVCRCVCVSMCVCARTACFPFHIASTGGLLAYANGCFEEVNQVVHFIHTAVVFCGWLLNH